jgi:hypothetical protein
MLSYFTVKREGKSILSSFDEHSKAAKLRQACDLLDLQVCELN